MTSASALCLEYGCFPSCLILYFQVVWVYRVILLNKGESGRFSKYNSRLIGHQIKFVGHKTFYIPFSIYMGKLNESTQVS